MVIRGLVLYNTYSTGSLSVFHWLFRLASRSATLTAMPICRESGSGHLSPM